MATGQRSATRPETGLSHCRSIIGGGARVTPATPVRDPPPARDWRAEQGRPPPHRYIPSAPASRWPPSGVFSAVEWRNLYCSLRAGVFVSSMALSIKNGSLNRC